MSQVSETGPPLRTCILTRTVRPAGELIRFVVDPDGEVVPDIRRVLPGRGVWVTARQADVAEAVRRHAFRRGLRREVRVAPDLGERVGRLIEREALARLSLARKAGLVTTGFEKVYAAVRDGRAAVISMAREAVGDGRAKLTSLVTGASRRHKTHIVDVLSGDDQSDALGGGNVVYAALEPGPLSEKFLEQALRLKRYRTADDPTAGAEDDGPVAIGGPASQPSLGQKAV